MWDFLAVNFKCPMKPAFFHTKGVPVCNIWLLLQSSLLRYRFFSLWRSAKQIQRLYLYPGGRLSLYGFKSFCLRDRGRLGNRGQLISLKFGTLSYHGDLCNMPKFQLHCSYLGWVLDVTLFGVPQCFFYSPFWALFNTLITISGIF